MSLLTKYQPTKIENLPISDNIVEKIKQISEFKGGVYIFHSLPGTGKSTACNLIIREAIKKLGSANLLSINGSMENTVDVVVSTIQPFASKAPKRLIIIEEADKLTKETGKGKGAQEALKDLTSRTMKRVTWIFVTNHLDDIIPALQDRATIINFKTDEYKMVEVLKRINEKEKLNYSVKELHNIVKTTYPSIRNSILKLEGADIQQFDETQLLKDLKRLILNELKPKTFHSKYKGMGVQTIVRYLLNIGHQYFDDDMFTRILVMVCFISELKDNDLSYTTFVYLLSQLNNNNWEDTINNICNTTISIKTISSKYYNNLQEIGNKKSKR